MPKPQVPSRPIRKEISSEAFSALMKDVKQIVVVHIKSQQVATYKITSNHNLKLDKIRDDLASRGIFGQVRYGGRRTKATFILMTNSLEVPETFSIENRVYYFSMFQEKIRTALATIDNIPFGAGPLIQEWVSKIGNVVELTLPNETTDTSTGRGQVRFSHVYYEEAFSPLNATIPIENHAPVVLRFATYAMKSQEFFLADEPSRRNILLQNALKHIQNKVSKVSKSYAAAVKAPPPPKSNPKTKTPPKLNNKRPRNDSISPSNRSPPPKKSLIQVMDEIKLPELQVMISPADISPTKHKYFEKTPLSFTPLNSKSNRIAPPGRGHPLN